MREYTIEDIKTILSSLLRNKLLIILFTFAATFGGLLYLARQPVEHLYGATAAVSVTFGASQGQIPAATILANYADTINSNLVCEYAAALLMEEGVSVQQIQRMISISSESNSYVLKINARNESPRLAILVANAVAEGFVAQVAVITGNNSIQILDAAKSADIVSSNGGSRLRLLIPAAAFALACAFVIVIELLSSKIHTVRQCIINEGELLAVIPRVKN